MDPKGIVLYHDLDFFDDAIDALDEKDYKIIEFDSEEITTTQILHFELKSKLHLPATYANNFDSLKECLLDYDIDAPGILVVIEHLDSIPFKNIYALLDVFSQVMKERENEDNKFIVYAQLDNKYFKLYKPVTYPEYINWNTAEKK